MLGGRQGAGVCKGVCKMDIHVDAIEHYFRYAKWQLRLIRPRKQSVAPPPTFNIP